MRCASLRGVEFFPMGKEEREGAALGTILLLFIFICTRIEIVISYFVQKYHQFVSDKWRRYRQVGRVRNMSWNNKQPRRSRYFQLEGTDTSLTGLRKIFLVHVSRFKEYKVEPKFWLIKFDEVLGNEIKDKLRRVFKMMLPRYLIGSQTNLL